MDNEREGTTGQVQREIIQHLAFIFFFVAGLFTTDLFMGDAGPSGSATNDLTRSAQRSRSSTPGSVPQGSIIPNRLAPAINLAPPNKPTRNTSYQIQQAEPIVSIVTTDDQLERARQLEQQRIETIQRVMPAVVSIFGLEREGGGSGVLIHPSGLALTNHHVVAATGAVGWGGLADGNLYRWELVGNDPGGDLALIRLLPNKEAETSNTDFQFPFVRLGDSDQVQVGDWTLVIGNPFTLAEDYRPTVTYGIVSGVKRYQPGMSDTLLVYGNCIQVDSSINPGNSGGPLFDMQGNLIGINGRASFEFRQRGRVNVGLGYAISVNQCRNFLPELMATKLIQHGTLDALFSDRDGKVICTAIYEDADIGKLGLELGDELLEFENEAIRSANQFTNLICTLPAGWPAHLKIRKPSGNTTEIRMRLLGLPYPKMDAPPPSPRSGPPKPDSDEKLPDDSEKPAIDPNAPPTLQQQIEASKLALFKFMSNPPGEVQNPAVNQTQARLLWNRWLETRRPERTESAADVHDGWVQVRETWLNSEGPIGQWNLRLKLSSLPGNASEPAELAKESLRCDELIAEWLEPEQGRGFIGWPVIDTNTFDALRWQSTGWSRGTRIANDEYEWETISEQQVLRSVFGFQVWAVLIALRSEEIGDQLTLHGADRVDQAVASRFQWMTNDNPTLLWLSLDDWTDAAGSKLIKVGADINGRRSSGSVRYWDWNSESTIPWPSERSIVSGLFEDPIARIKTDSITAPAAK